MIKVDVVTEFDEFQRLRAEWNDLLINQATDNNVFHTHEWFHCWWKCFSNTSTLFIVTVKEDGCLVGIAPMMISKVSFRGLPVKLLSFIENGNSLHNDFIIHAAKKYYVMPAIMDCVVGNQNIWDMIEIKNVPEDSNKFDVLKDVLHSHTVLFAEKKGLASPYIKIESDWETYLKSRSSKSRKTLRNIQNRFKKQGDYSIEKIEDIVGYKNVKSKLYEIAKDSWTEGIGDSLNSKINKLFFDELSRVAAEQGWLVIWLLHFNGEPIAFEYHLKYNGMVHGLRASHKESYGSISPGVFLDYHIMKNVFESGSVDEYDLGGSADFYKRKWTDKCRKHLDIQVFKKGIYSKLLYCYEHKLVPFVKRAVLWSEKCTIS